MAALGSVGVTDYDELENRPKVNNITLTGNKKSSDLKIAYSMTETDYSSASKNAESIYCLTENDPTWHVDITLDPDEDLSWTQDGDTYNAEYVLGNAEAISTTVVVDAPEAVTYEVSGTAQEKTVAFSTTTAPAELGDITITVDSVNDVGATRIVKDGVEYGKSTGIYSTSEVAIGKWIDGSTVYRKVISGINTSSGNDTWIDTDIDVSSVDVFVEGHAFDSYGQLFPVCLGKNGSGKLSYRLWFGSQVLTGFVILYTKNN